MAIVLCLSASGVATPQDAAQLDQLRRTAFVSGVQKAAPSVVNIHGHKTVARDSQHSQADREVQGMGTGVIIDPRGYILTNFHVVDGVKQIQVTMHDGNRVTGRLISHDRPTDLAVIKITSSTSLPTIKLGTSQDLLLAEPVIAVGNAYGYHHTVTRGVISALHRDVPVSDTQTYFNLIQTDASINPGNSGGPLLNVHGEMIGLNVAVRVGAQGIGFAIPVDDALEVAARLLSTQKIDRRWHGVVGATKYRNRAPAFTVSTIQGSSPAAGSGLQSGDVITQVAGMPIHRALDFERALIGRPGGQPVNIVAIRNGQTVRSQLTLALATDNSESDLVGRVWNQLGVRLTTLDAERFDSTGSGYRGGLKITAVRRGSPAERQNIRPGDVLVGIHKWETITMDNVAYVMSRPEFSGSRLAKCFILRDSRTHFAYLPVSDRRR